MEALAAVGLATNIIAFVDFSVKLLKGAKEISSKGSLSELDSIQDGTSRLQEFVEQLMVPTGLPATGAAKELDRLAMECAALANEIVSILRKIYATGPNSSRLKDIGIAWRAMTKRGKLESIQSRLDSYRRLILEQIALLIRQDQISISTVTENISKSQDENAKQLRTQLRSLQAELTTALGENKHDTDQSQRHVISVLQDVKSRLESLVSIERDSERINTILDKLWFDDMLSREASVENASDNSYRWILELPVEDKASKEPNEQESEELNRQEMARSHFNKWLESESGVFYISGKPGSGKSTLMKFLALSSNTRKKLEAWAAARSRPLILVSFFFWISGSQLQRSIEGLYRAILWEVLKQCPDLIPDVVPSRWESTDNQSSRISHLPLSASESQAAFERLRDVLGESYALCLFIDGLDEYDGDHWKLGDYLASWRSEHVKICVSARPYDGFQQTLPLNSPRHFELHKLNQGDMERYVKSDLLEDERFCQLQSQDQPITEKIIESLIQRAEGVFLWTVLATRAILEGLTSNNTAHQLLMLLENDIPDGLDAMFYKMLDRIPRAKQKQAAISLLVVSDPIPAPLSGSYSKKIWLNLIFHWYIEQIIQNSGHQSLIQSAAMTNPTLRPNLQTAAIDAIEIARARLNSTCAGFISWRHADYSFQITHRTLRDFLRNSKVKATLNGFATDIDLPALLGRACLNILHDFSGPPENLHTTWPTFWNTAKQLYKIAERPNASSDIVEKMALSVLDFPQTAPNICFQPNLKGGFTSITHISFEGPVFRHWHSTDRITKSYYYELAKFVCIIMRVESSFIIRHKKRLVEAVPETLRPLLLLATVLEAIDGNEECAADAFNVAKFLLNMGVGPNLLVSGKHMNNLGLADNGYVVNIKETDGDGGENKGLLGSTPSVWQLFLLTAFSWVLSQPNVPCQAVFNIIELFLAHGASPDMWFIVTHITLRGGENSLRDPAGFHIPAKLHRVSLRQLVEGRTPSNSENICGYLPKTKSSFLWPFAYISSPLRNSKIPSLANEELHGPLAPSHGHGYSLPSGLG
ncbi:uncharacterized protein PG998_006391 [Apiospora kogelbergensis]|uniref:uncharacterized protein n=1 Tax=Apiospora kogelbergensis TaxID=1337665 RepID=UPI00312CEF3B